MLGIEVSYYICFRHVHHVPENISTSRRCKLRPSEWNSFSSSPPASSYTSSPFPTCSSPSSTLLHRSRNKDNPGQNLLLEEPPTCRTSLLQWWQADDEFMADFEQALRSALSASFPGAEIDGCHFHFCQAILRNVNQLGYKTEYEAITTDPATGAKIHSSVHTWVRRLMMLALVPTADVPDIFNQLVENIPDTVQIDSLLAYFEMTWIAGLNERAARYPPASWNQTDRVVTDLNTTNNYCESFNKTFSSLVWHAHPTIYNFLSAVHLEQASTEGKMHSYRRGVQPPKRKKRYLEKDATLKHIVSTYHTYDNNVAAYLNLLAQL